MKRLLLLASLALALAAPAAAQRRTMGGPGGPENGPGGGPPRKAYANPSAGIAADIERARLTGGKKGRWFAQRQTAAPDAIMFVPQMVLAQPWLKSRTDMRAGYKLRPYSAWASCDGSLIVTSGAFRDGESQGWYTTVWQRQPDGVYRWVFDHGGPAEKPLDEPEMIEARVAECPTTKPAGPPPTPPAEGGRGKPRGKPKPLPIVLDPTGRSGRSNDGSLVWEVKTGPGGSHHFTASMRVSGAMKAFRDEKVALGGS